jgi:hypothetical protein
VLLGPDMCHPSCRYLLAALSLATVALGCGSATEETLQPTLAPDDAARDGSISMPDAARDSAISTPDAAGDGAISAPDAAGDGASPDSAVGDSSVTPPADAVTDVGPKGQWRDDAGVCRSNEPPLFRTCAATFQAAVKAGAPVGMVRSGWCGTMLVWISYATPSLGCAYDSTGATLVARYFGDDVPAHCGGTSSSVSTPGWPAGCTPAPLDAGPDAG